MRGRSLAGAAGMLVTLLGVCGAAWAQSATSESRKPIDSFSGSLADCDVIIQKRLPDTAAKLSLPGANGSVVQVPVDVRHSWCKIVPHEAKTESGYEYADLYEVCSTEPRVGFCWRMWSALTWGHIHVLHSEDGDYLAGAVLGSVRFVRIGEAISRDRALDAYVSGRSRASGSVNVPVTSLVPEAGDWGVNALYSDIDVTSLSKDESGNWVVCITNADRSKRYTLVQGRSTELGWRVQQ